MEKFVERLEEDLSETSDLIPTVTVSRSDLENLLWAYENTKKKAAADSKPVSVHEQLINLIKTKIDQCEGRETSPEELVALSELVDASLKTRNIL